MKNENKKLLSLSLLSAFMLTACGGDIPGLSTSDTDSDGLTDADEINLYHTNPDVADTDGDGYSDFEEIINKNFDASNSNYRFNPLIADVPKLNVSYGVPNFSLTYSTSTSTGNTYETGYDQTISTDTISTNGGDSSHSIARNFSASIAGEYQFAITGGVKLTTTATAGFTDTDSNGTNWSNTTQQSTGQTYSTLQTFSNSSGINVDSASMALFVSVENPGHVAYTLNDLSLSVTMAGDNASGFGIPIGTLLRAPNSTATIPLAVGGTATSEVYTLDMSLENYKTLINNYSNLVITPNVGDNNLGSDNNETNWVNLSDDVAIRTATISIDYGQARLPETYRVATALDINSQSLTLAQILNDIIKLPYSVQNDNLIPVGDTVAQASSSLASIRGVTMNFASRQMWFVAHEHTAASGVGTETDIYTPRVIQDFENLVIKAGDGVRMVYVRDSDSDNLTDREEFISGTDVNNPDTDGDSILDGDEVNGYTAANGSVYTSNPNLVDSDADGLSDFEEIALLTDPRNSDTDGDTASDGYEVSVGGFPTVDNTDIYAVDDDGDFLTNIEELSITGTDPTKLDTDNDGLSDSEELGRVSTSFSAQMPVVDHCVSKYNAAIVALNDPTYDNYKLSPTSPSRCDPLEADTDGDGINDGDEIAGWAPGYPVGSLLVPSNPFVTDSDNDGLTDDQEKLISGNPLAKDTDTDGMEDAAEIASVHNRSVIIPEVIVASSISTIDTNDCTGSFSGLFGFKEKQDGNAIAPLLAQFKDVPTNYLDVRGLFNSPSSWSNFLNVFNIAGPATTLHADAGYTNGIDSGNNYLGGADVEFVTDDGNYSAYQPELAPDQATYNSDWFAMSNEDPDFGTVVMEKSLPSMTKELVYHPQKIKIAQGQTLKAWSNNLCWVPLTATGNAWFRVGFYFSQTGAVPMECPAYYSAPFNKLAKEWTYSQFVDPDGAGGQPAPYMIFPQTEATTVQWGGTCQFTFTYDLQVVQE